jgi:hypothetical protein
MRKEEVSRRVPMYHAHGKSKLYSYLYLLAYDTVRIIASYHRTPPFQRRGSDPQGNVKDAAYANEKNTEDGFLLST